MTQMPTAPIDLCELATRLARHASVLEKACIHNAYTQAESVCGSSRLGDDCAAIEDTASGGYLLFASEGMLESFVAEDPWFAGYSAVMVNLSDVAAMGGRPIAITNTLWASEGPACDAIWQGMRAASEAYGVPIVGGHTTRISTDAPAYLGASVLGRAGKHLLTSFDARPGDRLVIAIDLNGAYRRDKPFWNASTTTAPERLRRNLELLPQLAERQLCRAAKDISNGGVVGTLAMLCACSSVGVIVDLETLPRPTAANWMKWLISFPSYGYVLAVSEERVRLVLELFHERGIDAAECGIFTSGIGVSLRFGHLVESVDFGAGRK
ncbi:sll0787 family AIR synthase-like protein [Pelagicoccus sp. SDUM812003]|uniref:sll0787 family AIR synthase-like protein n=1 Tax=Pelagicoccus sp. SDUM812003 TaxID=3041267 RepID=UPI00280EB090|nr:sll0787 family AIR synthase-like protein [Pelagicoccus sp. SDUM812003]MDQ8202170.1 sll0787 family AIR synthase-like protein [Pelagicoccus sp. SDUM812003]